MTDTMPSEFSSHLREIALRRRSIALAAAAVAVLAFVVSFVGASGFTATTTVRVALSKATSDDGAVTAFHAASIASMAPSDAVLRDAVAISGDDRSIATVRSAVSAKPDAALGVLRVTASAPTRDDAVDLANGVAAALDAAARRDAASRAVGADLVTVERARPADAVPSRSLVDSLGTAVALGLLAAVVVGEGLVALRLLRGRLSPVDPAGDVARIVGVPVLDLREGKGAGSAFLFYQQHLERRRLLTVVDLDEREGLPPRSAPAAQLARLAEEVHRRVVLVEADAVRTGARTSVGAAASATGALTEVSLAEPDANGERHRDRLPVAAMSRRLEEARQAIADAGADQAIVSITRTSSIDEVLRVAHTFPQAVVLSLHAESYRGRQLRSLLDMLRDVDVTVVAGIVR